MAESLGSAVLELRTDGRPLDRGVDRARGKAKGLERDFKRIGTSIASSFGLAFGGAALVQGIRKVTSLAQEQRQVLAQLEQGVRSTGFAAGFTTEGLHQMAGEMQKLTGIGDEVIERAQSILLTFTNISGDTFPRTTQAVLDLSTRMGGDLKAAAVQLGKALNDPVANLGELGRAGIQFSKSQKAVIKRLFETNRVAEAQALILEELERQFGGSAEAAAKAAGGGFKKLSSTLGDIGEKLGGPILAGLDLVARGFNRLLEQNIRDWTKFLEMVGIESKKAARVLGVRLAPAFGDVEASAGLSAEAIDKAAASMFGAEDAAEQAAAAAKKLAEEMGRMIRGLHEARQVDLRQMRERIAGALESLRDLPLGDYLSEADYGPLTKAVERAVREGATSGLVIEEVIFDKFAAGRSLQQSFAQIGEGAALGFINAVITSDLDSFFEDIGRRLAQQIAGALIDAGISGLAQGVFSGFGQFAGLAALGVAAFGVAMAAGAVSAFDRAFGSSNAITPGLQASVDGMTGAVNIFVNAVATFENAAMMIAEVHRTVLSRLGGLFGPIGGFRFGALPDVVPGGGGAGAGGGRAGGGGSGDTGGLQDFGEMLRVRLSGILSGVLDSFQIFIQELGGQWTVAIQGIATGIGDSLESATEDLLNRFARMLPAMIESGQVVLDHVPPAIVAVLKKGVAQTWEQLQEAVETATSVYVKSLGPVAGDLFVSLNTMIAEVAEAIRVGLPLDVAKRAVLNELDQFKNAVAGVELFPAFQKKREVLKMFAQALERLGIVGTEAAEQMREARMSVRAFNLSLRANVLGQLADLARQFGLSAEVIKKAELLRVRLQFLTLKLQLKALGLWERFGDLWRQLFRLAKQAARQAGEATATGFQHGTNGFMDFGRGTRAILHGQEEVTPKPKGESLAAMVGSAIRNASGGDAADQIRRLRAENQAFFALMQRQQQLIPILARNAALKVV